MFAEIKLTVKWMLAPLIYRFPPTGIQPERLAYFLNSIIETQNVPGPIVEVGSHLCGTSILARRLMRNLKIDKPYICVDTFNGFIPDQFSPDINLGTPKKDAHMFADNSIGLVRRILKMHGCDDIQLLQRDCTKLTALDFPEGISLCLLDVDLSEPVRLGLHSLYPLLNSGGKILVDDCPEGSSWRARVGLQAFTRESGLPTHTYLGMGEIEKRA